MKEKYLEQISNLKEETTQLSKVRRELDDQIEDKKRDADVLEARLSAIDSIIEASAIMTEYTQKENDLKQVFAHKENDLKQTFANAEEEYRKQIESTSAKVEKLTQENARLANEIERQKQVERETVGVIEKLTQENKQLSEQIIELERNTRIRLANGSQIIDKPITPEPEPEMDMVTMPSRPIDETLLTKDKKKSQSAVSS